MKNTSVLGKCSVLLLFLFVLSGRASARLGETFEECKARYGEPLRTIQTERRFSAIFEKAGLVIQVEFYDGKAGLMLFKKPNGLVNDPPTDVDIATLMRAEGSKSPWKQSDKMILGERGWKTEDGQLYAIVNQLGLTLATYDGMTRYIANGASEQHDNLKGF